MGVMKCGTYCMYIIVCKLLFLCITGSSASLNKAASESVSTPRSNRLFPLSPTTIGPIVESHESPFSSTIQSEQTKSSSSQLNQLSLGQRQSLEIILPHSALIRSKLVPDPQLQTPQKSMGSQTLPRNLNSSKLRPSKTKWTVDNAEQSRSPSEKRNSISGDTPSTEGTHATLFRILWDSGYIY